MATLSSTMLTLADALRRLDPDDKVAEIIMLLSQCNEVLPDILWLQCNQGNSHRMTVVTGLPSLTWRQLNFGVAASKGKTAQVVANCGMLEGYSVVDKDVARINGNTPEFRMSEDMLFLEQMSQTMASAVFYSNALSTPQQIMGLAPVYNTVTVANANTAANVIDGGGTGTDNCSVYLVGWGPRSIHGLYPNGSKGGVHMKDLGDTRAAYDSSNNQFEAWTTHYKWDAGLAVPDWRFGVRICNIDVSDLIAGTGLNLINAFIRAIHRLPTQPPSAGTEQTSDVEKGPPLDFGRLAFYCNRTVRTYMDVQAANKANALLTIEKTFGRPRTEFLGIPIRTCDALLNTESQVT